MKKIFLTVGAVLSFVLAGAQTTTTTTTTPPASVSKPVKTDVMEQDKREMEATPDGMNTTQPATNKVQPATVKPATGEPIAPDHVKSTPNNTRQRDTTAVKKTRKTKRS